MRKDRRLPPAHHRGAPRSRCPEARRELGADAPPPLDPFTTWSVRMAHELPIVPHERERLEVVVLPVREVRPLVLALAAEQTTRVAERGLEPGQGREVRNVHPKKRRSRVPGFPLVGRSRTTGGGSCRAAPFDPRNRSRNLLRAYDGLKVSPDALGIGTRHVPFAGEMPAYSQKPKQGFEPWTPCLQGGRPPRRVAPRSLCAELSGDAAGPYAPPTPGR